MKEQIIPSQTALFAAAARAAHPLVDQEPHLLHDEEAGLLCRTVSPSPLDYQLAQPEAPILAAARLSSCVRSRFAEAVLAEPGIAQVIVVGAGLDTSCFRLPASLRDRVWVIDRPGVLAWRSQVFEAAGLSDTSHHLAIDLVDGIDFRALEAAGVDLQRPAVVVWLGVSMYLSPADCRRFFTGVAGLAEGTSLVFDYILAPGLRDNRGAGYASALAGMAGGADEPWHCTAEPASMHEWLADAGWRIHDDLGEEEATPAGFWGAQKHVKPMNLVRLVHASLGPGQAGDRRQARPR